MPTDPENGSPSGIEAPEQCENGGVQKKPWINHLHLTWTHTAECRPSPFDRRREIAQRMNIRNIIRGGIGNRERCLRFRCREMLFAKRESLVLGTNFFCYLTREHTHPNTLEHSFCYLLFLHTLTNTQPLFAVQRFFFRVNCDREQGLDKQQ